MRLLGASHAYQARSKTSITSADTSVERVSHQPSRACKHDRRFHAASRAEAYRVVFLSNVTTNSVQGPCSPKPGSLIAVSSREAACYPHASYRQSITHRITYATLTETTPYPLFKYLLQSVDTQNTSQWKTGYSLLPGVDLVSSRGSVEIIHRSHHAHHHDWRPNNPCWSSGAPLSAALPEPRVKSHPLRHGGSLPQHLPMTLTTRRCQRRLTYAAELSALHDAASPRGTPSIISAPRSD
jgi:hypothetical protein